MNCRDCSKKLKGGFKQDDGGFLCADCVIAIVERNGREYAKGKALGLIETMLMPGLRPTKRGLREVRSWIKCIDYQTKPKERGR